MAVRDASVADIESIRRGFSWSMAGRFQRDLGLNDRDFAGFLGVSSRTLTRRRQGAGALDKVASDRLYRIMRVMKLSEQVFQDAASGLRWLRGEQPGLGGRVPLELLDTEPGFEAVETLLQRIEYGVIV